MPLSQKERRKKNRKEGREGERREKFKKTHIEEEEVVLKCGEASTTRADKTKIV